MSVRIASVIVDVPARAIDRPFYYSVPDEIAADVRVGCAVSVEFGNRPVVGYVVGLCDFEEADGEAPSAPMAAPRQPADAVFTARSLGPPLREHLHLDKLKPILGVLSDPYFDKTAAELVSWIAHEYLCTLPDALHLFTPPGGAPKIKRVDDEWQLVFSGVGPVDDRWVVPTDAAISYEPPKSATKQKRILDALTWGGMRVAELALELGNVNASIKALEKKGIVRVENRRRIREAMPACGSQKQDGPLSCSDVFAADGGLHAFCEPDGIRPRTGIEDRQLTAGQLEALEAIEDSLAGASSTNVIVMDGITGSGKTEVYLRAIEDVLAMGRSAIVLVPEIALTPQTVGRFRGRFGDDVAVLHSRLSAGERFDQWDLVREGLAHVVVGTRSALFAPVHELGLVIIDEEHDSSYKQDSAPRYNARDVALELCERRGATLVLGSATPSIETLAKSVPGSSLNQGWELIELPERPTGQLLPEVEVVDMAREFKGGSRSMFSKALVDALQEVHERGEKAVLLLNRRGFASFVLCRECGFVPECPHCATSLTYHEREGVLACHHCDHIEPMPAKCPECGSPYLRKFGAGTERVEAELRSIVPDDMPIIRMDADTTKGKGAHEKLLEQFASADGGVLLGTQMIAKGLDFPDVTLVGVINADTTLKLPDFRASERTYQLLEQVSGRAGRAEKPGRVIVQTYMPEHPAIRAAAKYDRRLFLDATLPMREELGYPPYERLANVLAWGKREPEVRQAIAEITLAISSAVISAGEDWEVLGPAPCLLSRLRGVYRWHTLIKAPLGADIAGIVEPVLKARKKNDEVRIAVDVDPDNLF